MLYHPSSFTRATLCLTFPCVRVFEWVSEWWNCNSIVHPGNHTLQTVKTQAHTVLGDQLNPLSLFLYMKGTAVFFHTNESNNVMLSYTFTVLSHSIKLTEFISFWILPCSSYFPLFCAPHLLSSWSTFELLFCKILSLNLISREQNGHGASVGVLIFLDNHIS